MHVEELQNDRAWVKWIGGRRRNRVRTIVETSHCVSDEKWEISELSGESEVIAEAYNEEAGSTPEEERAQSEGECGQTADAVQEESETLSYSANRLLVGVEKGDTSK